MTSIRLKSAGKKFEGRWIFQNIDLDLNGNDKLAVTGFNGSGKSTLLQIISAYKSPSSGSVEYYINDKAIPASEWHQYISCGAPYLDIPEDLTLAENIIFFKTFKPLQKNLSVDAFAKISGLENYKDKRIKNFSSGMKQRFKIALAVLADVPVLLLDEPLSNLDKNGFEWYSKLVKDYSSHKMLVVCSNNQQQEIDFCTKFIDLSTQSLGFRV